MKKDYILTTIGGTHRIDREENDFYATEPKAAELLLQCAPYLENIWECACGQGHLARVFKDNKKLSLATDLIYRGYGLFLYKYF